MHGRGVCVVGGVHGRGVCMAGGVHAGGCMLGGVHAGGVHGVRDTVNEWAVRILLECILVGKAITDYLKRIFQIHVKMTQITKMGSSWPI